MADNDWRALVAALANDRVREVYAAVVLGRPLDEALDGLSPSRRRHVLATLVGSGLMVETAEGLRPDPTVFARALAAAPRAPRPQGIERFLTPDGRIRSYPANPGERAELLGLVAARTLAPGDVVSEAEFNERISFFTTDAAVLRRYLVDHGFVERTRSGSAYALVEQ